MFSYILRFPSVGLLWVRAGVRVGSGSASLHACGSQRTPADSRRQSSGHQVPTTPTKPPLWGYLGNSLHVCWFLILRCFFLFTLNLHSWAFLAEQNPIYEFLRTLSVCPSEWNLESSVKGYLNLCIMKSMSNTNLSVFDKKFGSLS